MDLDQHPAVDPQTVGEAVGRPPGTQERLLDRVLSELVVTQRPPSGPVQVTTVGGVHRANLVLVKQEAAHPPSQPITSECGRGKPVVR